MLAIKASYKNGKIILIDPIPVQIKEARLTIVVEPYDESEKLTTPAQEFIVQEKESEEEYELIGLNSFFDIDNDKNINWEEYFGLK